MATWTKSKCKECGNIERYHGKPSVSDLCLCCNTHNVKVIEIHWGKGKYAGAKAGTVEKFPIG